MLQAIRMCLWPTVANGNNTPRLLVSLGCASGTNFTSGIIPIILIHGAVLILFYQYIRKNGNA